MTTCVRSSMSHLTVHYHTTQPNLVLKLKKKNSCSTQLSMKFFLLINVEMRIIVGILKFMSRKNSIIGISEPEKSRISWYFYAYEHLKFHALLNWVEKFNNLRPRNLDNSFMPPLEKKYLCLASASCRHDKNQLTSENTSCLPDQHIWVIPNTYRTIYTGWGIKFQPRTSWQPSDWLGMIIPWLMIKTI